MFKNCEWRLADHKEDRIMSDFIFRTEDIKLEDILDLYVETSKDKRVVDLLKSANPIILEGSHGTGKSFLLRIAEAQLTRDFSNRPDSSGLSFRS